MKRTRTDEDAPTTVFIRSQQDVPHWCDEDTYNIVRFESLPTTMNVRRHGDLMIDAKLETLLLHTVEGISIHISDGKETGWSIIGVCCAANC